MGPERVRVPTGRTLTRLCLVLDCLVPHDYDLRSHDFINLQLYVIKEKKLCESEAAVILYNTVSVVNDLHQVSNGYCPFTTFYM